MCHCIIWYTQSIQVWYATHLCIPNIYNFLPFCTNVAMLTTLAVATQLWLTVLLYFTHIKVHPSTRQYMHISTTQYPPNTQLHYTTHFHYISWSVHLWCSNPRRLICTLWHTPHCRQAKMIEYKQQFL